MKMNFFIKYTQQFMGEWHLLFQVPVAWTANSGEAIACDGTAELANTQEGECEDTVGQTLVKRLRVTTQQS